MARKVKTKKTLTVAQQLASLQNTVRDGFRQNNERFQQIDERFQQIDRRFDVVDFKIDSLRKEVNERFALVDERIDRLATHVDSFMKLHETLDIEFRVLKEQMNRIEERLKIIESARAG